MTIWFELGLAARVPAPCAALLRARHFNYISLETALSDAGLISKMPMAWITVVSTGRSSEISCGRFGTIEFIHTERPMSQIIDDLTYDADRHLFRASTRLALADMHRFNRSTIDLVQEPEDDIVLLTCGHGHSRTHTDKNFFFFPSGSVRECPW